jgi:hypothetical protein
LLKLGQMVAQPCAEYMSSLSRCCGARSLTSAEAYAMRRRHSSKTATVKKLR